jgi:glucose/mannose-6-phosphate isomerase
MSLDRPETFAAVDPHDALGDVEATPAQWAHARELADVRLDLDGVDAVVVTGMGGSGICGDVVAALAADRLGVPVTVSKGYGLPRFVGPRTLVVACSYSGSTEETRSAIDAAEAAGARLFAVTSGGQLAERCAAAGYPLVRVPEGRQPRHSLWYLAVPVLVALGLDDGADEAAGVLADLAAGAGRHVSSADNPAKQLGLRLASGAVPLVWGARGLGSVAAYRLKCQLNENAKMLAFASEMPELNHNEIVGFAGRAAPVGNVGLVILRDPVGEHVQVGRRFAVTEQVVGEGCAWIAVVAARGTSPLARLASLVLMADLTSVYTALELSQDPTPVAYIDRLKAELSRT